MQQSISRCSTYCVRCTDLEEDGHSLLVSEDSLNTSAETIRVGLTGHTEVMSYLALRLPIVAPNSDKVVSRTEQITHVIQLVVLDLLQANDVRHLPEDLVRNRIAE